MLTSRPTPTEAPPDPAPEKAMLVQLANRYRLSQCIHVAARLGVADVLAEGPLAVTELARRTDSHAPSLYRLLRALASLGIFEEIAPAQFALTPLAATLKSDATPSLRASAIVVGEPWHWQMWEEVLYSVSTGKPAFDHLNGLDFPAWLATQPEAARHFNEAMVSVFALADNAIASVYDFGAFGRVVDVGLAGGWGSLTRLLLGRNPELQVTLVDFAENLGEASKRLRAAGVAERATLVAGDFFAPLPAGGDCYILKNLIHDFDDAQAKAILENCRAALAPGGKLLVAEMVVPPGNEPGMGKLVDIEALLMTDGGRERTEAEYRQLLESAGFSLLRTLTTRSPLSVLEAAVAPHSQE